MDVDLLQRLSGELELDRLVQLLTDEATALCRAQFGAFFYNVDDAAGGSYMLYTISGVPREAFSKFPMPRNTAVFAPTFTGEGVVRSDDITRDPRYGHNAPYHGMPAGHLPVCSYLAVPVQSRAGRVIGGLFFGHSSPAVFTAADEQAMVAVAAQAGVAFENAQLYAEARRARVVAEAMQNRFRFLADASDVLAESLDYESTLRRVAELAVPRIADWCTFAVVGDEGHLERVAAVHRDPALAARMDEYEHNYPPGGHRAGGFVGVFERGETVFLPTVSDADLAAAAQSPAHLELMRAIGCASCLMVPVNARGRTLGVLSFNIADAARQFSADDVRVAEELAHRAALAIDNAKLYRALQHREAANAFLAEASAVLGSSLDYAITLQTLANLVVPRFADWCAVDVLEEGRIRQVAVAHVDPKKVAYAHELQRRWPPDPNAPTGSPAVIRSGKAELFPEITQELVEAVVTDRDQLHVLRELGLRSALTVPLVARGRTLGAVTLIWAESGRRYGADDVVLMEELGRRAGTAVDNARLYHDAQSAVKLRDEFLSIASHELRTPLTSLQLLVSNLVRILGRRQPEHQSSDYLIPKLTEVDRQIDRLAMLIGALLDVSRATSGRLALEVAEVPLSELIGQLVGRLDADLKSARSEIKLALDDGIVGRWDRLRLDQIITNLVGNAIKYGPGAPIEIATRRVGDRVEIDVRDRGIGIAEADHTRIFERFARAVPADNFGGLGLGLWIVRVFVEAMHGTVRVVSAPKKGATFTVSLPLVVTTDAAP
ncbi:MAG TPA: GAF domain-containing protein [Polyangia bacterium]|nr:GAF domain-containing protein [Polyangia bacterium]